MSILDNVLYVNGDKLIEQLRDIKSAGYTSVDIDGVIKMIYAAAKEQQIHYC